MMPPLQQTLEPGRIHYFYTRTGQVTDPALLFRYRSMLSPDEIVKVDRYMFEKDRHTSLITRALVRDVLAAFTGRPPESLKFEPGRFGKPYLKTGQTDLALRFNLSHSRGITALAVVLDHDIGVDVEDTQRNTDLAIADRFFSADEAKRIRQSRGSRQSEIFYTFWTLKEAYIKALGKGLSVPLDSFGFQLGDGRISLRFTGQTDESPEGWQFFNFSLMPHVMTSVAVRAPSGSALVIDVREHIPFEP